MKTAFLREKDSVDSGSYDLDANVLSPPTNSDAHNWFDKDQQLNTVDSWVELWDYAGGNSFRGFVAGTGEEKCLFVFFNPDSMSKDLKQA